MDNKSDKQSVGRPEPEFKFDVGTVIFIIIGFMSSWINMIIILYSMQVAAYLSIIFTTMIPGIIIAVKNRYWGYGYMVGFAVAGIPFSFLKTPDGDIFNGDIFIGDLFIGWYTFFTALFLFIIMWLVFWKAWRSLSSIKSMKE